MALAWAGADVVIADLLAKQTVETAEKIQKEARSSLAIPVDVTRETDGQKMVEQVKYRFGRIDLLVNHAGINVICPAEDFPQDQWKRVVDVSILPGSICAPRPPGG